MKSIHQFIVEPLNDQLYANKRLIGDKELVMSSSFENHKATNRIASVVAVPADYLGPISEGALIVVHHNVFRKYLDMKGVERYSKDRLFDNKYTIYHDVIYAYKNDWSQMWTPMPEYCFVTPIDNDEDVKMTSEKQLYGKMLYSNEYLREYNINDGDIVGFTPDSEYEFNIDGVKMYRIKSSDICLKI